MTDQGQTLSPLARAGRNLLFKSVGETLARACFAALFIFAARVIGAEEYGRYSFASSLAALALIGMDLGLNTLFVRDCARQPNLLSKYSGSLLVIKLGLGFLMLSLIYIFCLSQGYAYPDIGLILLVAGAQALWGLSELGVAGFNALERMDLDAMVKAIGRLTALVAAGALLLSGLGVWGLALGLLIANSTAASISLTKLAHMVGFRPTFNPAFFKDLFKDALPLALTNIFILVYFRVDIVMMEIMGLSFEQIGWYSAAVRIIDAIGMVPTMASAALLPVLSSLAQTNPKAMAKLYRQGQRLLLILGLPSAVGLLSVRSEITSLIYGPQFAPTAPVFIWLAPMLALLFVNFLQLSMLTAQGRQRLCAIATGFCVIVNVGLNLWLIPTYGFIGAAAATLFTQIALFVQCSFFIGKTKGAGGLAHSALRPFLAAGFMGGCLYLGGDLPVVLTILLGVIIYAVSLVIFKGLTLEELKELWHMLKKSSHKNLPS